jgi:hypothetical protein
MTGRRYSFVSRIFHAIDCENGTSPKKFDEKSIKALQQFDWTETSENLETWWKD